MTSADLPEQIAVYRDAAERQGTSNPAASRRWHRALHNAYKLLRESPEGRAAIMELMSDPTPHARLWAAAQCLSWHPEHARSVLEEPREGETPSYFEARRTLIEYDRGKLSFDYA